MSEPIYCGRYGCDNGVVWMMSEFPVPCEDCRKLREAAKAKGPAESPPATPPRAVRPQSLADERYKQAWRDKERLR